MTTRQLIAVDIGNSRMKLGRFGPGGGGPLPEPLSAVQLPGDSLDGPQLSAWLAAAASELQDAALDWWIGSVNRPAATRLLDWLRDRRPHDAITLVAAADLPLTVRLPRPDMVGIDRLLDALAANRLRQPGRAAVVVDVGSAITVDLVGEDGAFLGGAILPGIGMAARAMHEFTDLLPLIEMSELAAPPPPLGTATVPAIKSGLFWGAVGAIRELVGRLGEGLTQPPHVFLSGGAGPAVADLLGPDARCVPHLTLAGIALAAGRAATA